VLARPVGTHWQFSIVVLAAIGVRFMVVLGYPPILWFNDSYNYIYDAIVHVPEQSWPDGYPAFLFPSGGALAADLRRHFGRGGAVEKK
jgi:hypothetical protein